MSALADPSTSTSKALVCGSCGAPALDVHLLPYPHLAREPERAVLSCGDCDAGGLRLDLDDWTIGCPRLYPDDTRPDADEERYTLRDHYLDVKVHGVAAVELVEARLDGSSPDAGSFEPITGKSFDEMLLDAVAGDWPEWVPYKSLASGDNGRAPASSPAARLDYVDDYDRQRYREPARPARERIVDMVEAIKSSAEPIDYPCEPIVARGYVTVLSGRRGDAKSWLAMAIAHAVHSDVGSVGGWLEGLRCRHGRALYVDAENGPYLLARRFVTMGIADDGLVVADATGMHLPHDMEELFALCDVVEPTMIVLDSLRRLAPMVREDKSDDVALLMAELSRLSRERNVGVLLIAHRSTKQGASDTRGSSAIEDQADCVFVLERLPNDPDRDRRRLRCAKFRLDREPQTMWLRLAKTAGLVSIEIAGPLQKSEANADHEPEASAQELLVERIRALGRQALADDGWPPSRLAEALGVDQRNGTFKRALSALLEGGEWDASGQGRARRLRPANEPGQQALPIGGGPVGPVDSPDHDELATPEQEALLDRAQQIVEGEGAQG